MPAPERWPPGSGHKSHTQLQDLTRLLIAVFSLGGDNLCFRVADLSSQVKVQNRRFYDVIAVLDSLRLVERRKGSKYIWLGIGRADKNVQERLVALREHPISAEALRDSFALSSACQWLVSRVHEAAGGQVYLEAVRDELRLSTSQYRRFYDIANILESLGFIRIVRRENSTPSYVWAGTSMEAVARACVQEKQHQAANILRSMRANRQSNGLMDGAKASAAYKPPGRASSTSASSAPSASLGAQGPAGRKGRKPAQRKPPDPAVVAAADEGAAAIGTMGTIGPAEASEAAAASQMNRFAFASPLEADPVYSYAPASLQRIPSLPPPVAPPGIPSELSARILKSSGIHSRSLSDAGAQNPLPAPFRGSPLGSLQQPPQGLAADPLSDAHAGPAYGLPLHDYSYAPAYDYHRGQYGYDASDAFDEARASGALRGMGEMRDIGDMGDLRDSLSASVMSGVSAQCDARGPHGPQGPRNQSDAQSLYDRGLPGYRSQPMTPGGIQACSSFGSPAYPLYDYTPARGMFYSMRVPLSSAPGSAAGMAALSGSEQTSPAVGLGAPGLGEIGVAGARSTAGTTGAAPSGSGSSTSFASILANQGHPAFAASPQDVAAFSSLPTAYIGRATLSGSGASDSMLSLTRQAEGPPSAALQLPFPPRPDASSPCLFEGGAPGLAMSAVRHTDVHLQSPSLYRAPVGQPSGYLSGPPPEAPRTVPRSAPPRSKAATARRFSLAATQAPSPGLRWSALPGPPEAGHSGGSGGSRGSLGSRASTASRLQPDSRSRARMQDLLERLVQPTPEKIPAPPVFRALARKRILLARRGRKGRARAARLVSSASRAEARASVGGLTPWAQLPAPGLSREPSEGATRPLAPLPPQLPAYAPGHEYGQAPRQFPARPPRLPAAIQPLGQGPAPGPPRGGSDVYGTPLGRQAVSYASASLPLPVERGISAGGAPQLMVPRFDVYSGREVAASPFPDSPHGARPLSLPERSEPGIGMELSLDFRDAADRQMEVISPYQPVVLAPPGSDFRAGNLASSPMVFMPEGIGSRHMTPIGVPPAGGEAVSIPPAVPVSILTIEAQHMGPLLHEEYGSDEQRVDEKIQALYNQLDPDESYRALSTQSRGMDSGLYQEQLPALSALPAMSSIPAIPPIPSAPQIPAIPPLPACQNMPAQHFQEAYPPPNLQTSFLSSASGMQQVYASLSTGDPGASAGADSSVLTVSDHGRLSVSNSLIQASPHFSGIRNL